MVYKQLGATDIQVSRICLGTMTWGYQNTEEEAHRQIDIAKEHGVNFMDTAEIYAVPPNAKTYGKTETYIGTYFKKHPEKRNDWYIATKVVGPGVSYIRGGEGFTPEGITKAIEGSLKRLNTDYVDLYQLHWTQRPIPRFGARDLHADGMSQDDKLRETLRVLGELVQKGLVGHIGVSNENSWGVMKCLQLHKEDSTTYPRVESVQNAYSLVNRRADTELAEVLVREEVSLLPYSPLAGGLLTGKYCGGARPQGARFSTWGAGRLQRYVNSGTGAAVNRYVELARAHNISPAQMALSFVNNRVFVASNIIGATTEAQLRECVESDDVVLSAEVLQKIEAIHADIYNPSA